MQQTLADVIFEKAEHYWLLDALRVQGKNITYQELCERALIVAAVLSENGASGEAVGLVGQRCLSSYVGVLGILFSGCYYTPINPKYSEERLVSILGDSKVRFLVGDQASIEKLENILISLFR